MKIVYITAQIPWGRAETFILSELMELKRRGVDLVIVPRTPSKELFYEEAKELVVDSIRLPLVNSKMIANFFYSLITEKEVRRVTRNIFSFSRNKNILLKNLAVMPKAVYVADILRTKKIEHIHAHWGATTSTIAYIISKLLNIPWSVTLHRGDIKQNNMLIEKAESATFLRCISRDGKRMLSEHIGENYMEKVNIIHMGVSIPKKDLNGLKTENSFVVGVPANLTKVKGHKYLIEACAILAKNGINNFRCIFWGEGPLRRELEALIKEKHLEGCVKMPGAIDHCSLLEIYRKRQVSVVVIPSVNVDDGEHEGIPVSLMEAMAYRIAVISTNTGGIPELLSDGAGIMVEEKKAGQIAKAIKDFLANGRLKNRVGEDGYQYVKKEFNVVTVVTKLLDSINGGAMV